ncbi:alpha/beta fold hydrolase, partial [Streptomyces sp. NPDC058964]|uniref:alpha/beta fold hydrolase n=1 Tax=Streptomyces sp. NPDC058964 TaxID=3346681 RepID=UPI003678486E
PDSMSGRTLPMTSTQSETAETDDGVRLWAVRAGGGEAPLVLCHGGHGLWDMVPVLIVDGARDIRPRTAVDSLERALPRVRRMVLPSAGHLPWVEEPDGFREALRQWADAGRGSPG